MTRSAASNMDRQLKMLLEDLADLRKAEKEALEDLQEAAQWYGNRTYARKQIEVQIAAHERGKSV